MNDDIRNEMDRMNGMRLPELQTYYEEIVGEETRAPNKTFLIRKILAALEARAAGQAAGTAHGGSEEPSCSKDEEARTVEDEVPGGNGEGDGVDSEVSEPDDADEQESESPEEVVDFEDQITDCTEVEGDEAEEEQLPEIEESGLQEEQDAGEPDRPRLKDLGVEQLRDRYREVVGRETGSHHLAYLKWKIRQAERGLVPVGPRRRRGTANPQDFKVLPLRIKTSAVQQMDEAWKRLGLKSRTELFKKAIGAYLEENGEGEVACLFVGTEGR